MHLRAQRLARQSRAHGVLEGGGAADVTQAIEDEPRAGQPAQRVGHAPKVVHARIAVQGDVLHISQLQPAFTQNIADGLRGHAGPVFNAAKALFLRAGDQPTIAHEARGRVAVERIQAKDD